MRGLALLSRSASAGVTHSTALSVHFTNSLHLCLQRARSRLSPNHTLSCNNDFLPFCQLCSAHIWPSGYFVQIFRFVSSILDFQIVWPTLFARSEYGTLWRPVIGVLSYVVTQMVKMMIIAGLINLSPLWDHIIDCIGMYYFLVHHQKASVASVKILSMLAALKVKFKFMVMHFSKVLPLDGVWRNPFLQDLPTFTWMLGLSNSAGST